jgi:hypothetical protein
LEKAPNEHGSLPKRRTAGAVAQNPAWSRGLGAQDQLNRLASGEEKVRSAFAGRGGRTCGRGGGALAGFSSRSWKGEEERMGGGGRGRCHMEGGKWERGRVPSASVSRARRRNMASNGPRPLGAGGAVVAEQGRAVGRGRRGATDKHGRTSQGPSVSGGVQEGERRVRQRGSRALTCRPNSKLGLNRTKIQMGSNQFQIPSNFLKPNRTFPVSKNLK